MKAILKSEKKINEVRKELSAWDRLFYKANESFQGTFESPLDILEKYDVSECGNVYLEIKNDEQYYGWSRSSGVYCFIGAISGTVVCSGTRHSLAELFDIFGVNEDSEVIYVESQSSKHPACYDVFPDIKNKYDRIANSYSGTRLYQQFEKAGLSIEVAKRFGY